MEETQRRTAEEISKEPKLSQLIIWGVVAIIGLGLFAFSQTVAYYGDEGWNLLAAQLVREGKSPYLDFFYQHPPFWIYLTAGWIWLFGESWRAVHAMSSVLLSGSILMVAAFVFSRLRETGLGTASAVSAALLVGLNVLVIEFGTIAQPYALCLFLTVTSFLFVTATIQRRGLLAFGGGLFAGAAAASSFLTAAVGPVLFLWMAKHSKREDRWKKCCQFICGGIVPFVPVLWLAMREPRVVLFNIIEFHMRYRRHGVMVKARNLNVWDLKVLTSWLDSTQGLLLGFLAILGLLFLAGRNDLGERRKSEFRLCAWILLASAVYLCTAHPTFPQYFTIIMPFVAILASLGIYAIALRLWTPKRSFWLVLGICGLFAFGAAKEFYKKRADFLSNSGWLEIEEVAREVNRVLPENGVMYAEDRGIYFVARRTPPRGLENPYAPLRVPPELQESLRVMPQAEIMKLFENGRFGAAVVWSDTFGLNDVFEEKKRFRTFLLFWQWKSPSRQSGDRNPE